MDKDLKKTIIGSSISAAVVASIFGGAMLFYVAQNHQDHQKVRNTAYEVALKTTASNRPSPSLVRPINPIAKTTHAQTPVSPSSAGLATSLSLDAAPASASPITGPTGKTQPASSEPVSIADTTNNTTAANIPSASANSAVKAQMEDFHFSKTTPPIAVLDRLVNGLTAGTARIFSVFHGPYDMTGLIIGSKDPAKTQKIIAWVLPDAKAIVVGSVVNAHGQNMTVSALNAAKAVYGKEITAPLGIPQSTVNADAKMIAPQSSTGVTNTGTPAVGASATAFSNPTGAAPVSSMTAASISHAASMKEKPASQVGASIPGPMQGAAKHMTVQQREAALRGLGFDTIGEGKGPVYLTIFFDPNCSACNGLWTELHSIPDFAKKFSIQWIPVGVIKPSSTEKAANILNGGLSALNADESGFDAATEEGAAARTGAPAALVATVHANSIKFKALMEAAKIGNGNLTTPTIIIDGKTLVNGEPDLASLKRIAAGDYGTGKP